MRLRLRCGSSCCSPAPGHLAATGQFAEGHAALLESLQLVPPNALALRVRLTTACAGVEHLLGRHDQAHARLVSAMESLQDPASPAAAELMIALAMDGFHLMDYARMCEWAERALTTAQGLDDRPLAAAAAAVLAFANAANGAIAVAETRCSQAAALVADLSDDQLAIRLDAAVHLAGAELYLDRYPRDGGPRRASDGDWTGDRSKRTCPARLLDSRSGQDAARAADRSKRHARQRRRGRATIRQRAGPRRKPGQPISHRGCRG